MTGERRTDTEIRAEMEAERQELAAALADLRRDLGAKRRLAARAGGALAAATALTLALRRRGRSKRASGS